MASKLQSTRTGGVLRSVALSSSGSVTGLFMNFSAVRTSGEIGMTAGASTRFLRRTCSSTLERPSDVFIVCSLTSHGSEGGSGDEAKPPSRARGARLWPDQLHANEEVSARTERPADTAKFARWL